MNFDKAMNFLINGHKVQRKSWCADIYVENTPHMTNFQSATTMIDMSDNPAKILAKNQPCVAETVAFMVGDVEKGWIVTFDDVNADDWKIVE